MSGLFVYLVGSNRQMYMLSVLWCAYLAKWQDGVMVLWCCFHYVCRFLSIPSLHALVFIQKTFLGLVSVVF